MRLSILICSLQLRAALLARLRAILEPQQVAGVEMLIAVDNGEQTVGHKRQALLQQAKGAYVCFIDDDDLVSANYVAGLLEAVQSSPDVVAIEGKRVEPSGVSQRMLVGPAKDPRALEDPSVLRRTFNHLCPVRRELALTAGFADMDCGEDCDYSVRLQRLVKRWVYADPARVQYFYRYDPTQSATFSNAIYANRFGTNYSMEWSVWVGTGETVSCVVAGNRVVMPGPGRYDLSVTHNGKECRISTENDRAVRGESINISDPLPSRVEIVGNNTCIRLIRATVGGRPVVLRHKRAALAAL
jgi:hypothetical protein